MLKRYGFWGALSLFKSLVYTRLYFSNARLIRLPFDIRNKRYIKIGKGFTSGFGCRIEAFPVDSEAKTSIQIGENVQINDYVHIGAVSSIEIGDNVLMASKVYITDHNHGRYDDEFSDHPMSIPAERLPGFANVKIMNNVWLGESVCVLPGITIGEGSIIGALSVVSRDIPPYTIAVGAPAKVVKKYDFKLNKWVKV